MQERIVAFFLFFHLGPGTEESERQENKNADFCPCHQDLGDGETPKKSKDRRSICPFYLQFLEKSASNVGFEQKPELILLFPYCLSIEGRRSRNPLIVQQGKCKHRADQEATRVGIRTSNLLLRDTVKPFCGNIISLLNQRESMEVSENRRTRKAFFSSLVLSFSFISHQPRQKRKEKMLET